MLRITASVAAANPNQPPSHTKASITGMAITAVIIRWPTERFHCLLVFSDAFVFTSCSLTGCTRLLIAILKPNEDWLLSDLIFCYKESYIRLRFFTSFRMTQKVQNDTKK